MLKTLIVAAMALFIAPAMYADYNPYLPCQLLSGGVPVPGAQVYFLTSTGNTDTLTPQVKVYASSTGTILNQPVITNGMGICTAFLPAGTYTVVFISAQTGKVILTNQVIGATPQTNLTDAGTVGSALSATVHLLYQLVLT